MEAVKFIIETGLGATGLAVVIFFMKSYFENIHQRINDIQAFNDAKFNDIYQRISNIEARNKDVLELVLEKFSHWEDRILGLISKMDKMSPNEISKEIESLKVTAVEEMTEVKMRVAKINLEIKKITNEPHDDMTKKLLLSKIEKQKEELDEKVKYFDECYYKLFKVVTALNDRLKANESKTENLIQAHISKVKLK